MSGRFEGDTAIITGAARGLGHGIAEGFLREGADVVLADVDEDRLARSATDLRASLPGEVEEIVTDVARAADVKRMAECALEWRGKIDHLINNAGIVRIAPLVQSEEEDWDRVLDVNLKGVFLGIRSVLPHMLERKRGSIVNIASQAGKRGNRFIAPYCASKAGVISLTQTAALEAAPHVRVNCVCPGFINTELQEEEYEQVASITGEDRDQIKASWLTAMPLGKFQEVEDVTDGVLFLSSNAAAQTTGEALNISGGMVMD